MIKDTIKVVRLITGEDILCQLQETSNDMYDLVDPVRIAIVPNRTEANFGFAAWPVYNEQKKGTVIKIGKQHVMFITTPAEEFLNQYDSIFGSGIITPQKSLITG